MVSEAYHDVKSNYYDNTVIRLSKPILIFCTFIIINVGNGQKLRLKSMSFENLTPELVAKSMWMSTALAMIFALPPVGLFIGLYQAGFSVAIAAAVGFGVHFVILALSRKISSGLAKLFED
jgi:hypothetical protein